MRKRSLLVATFSAAWACSLSPLYAQSMGGSSSGGSGGGGGGRGNATTGATGSQYGFGSIMESGGPNINRTTGFGQATIFGTRDLGVSSSGANRSFSGQQGSLGVYGGGSGGGLGGRGALGAGVGGLGVGGGALGGNFAGGMGGARGGLGGGLGGMGMGGMGMGMGGMGMGIGGMGGMSALGGGMGRSGMGGGMMGGQMGGQMGRNQMGMGQNRNSTVRPIRPRLNIGFTPNPIAAPQVTAALTTRFNELGSQRQGIRIESRGPVQVSLDGQTAILRGVVATEHDREVAATMALLEPGVSQVKNELRVAPPASAD